MRLRRERSRSGDPPLLHQVFLNLLANAVKYTRTRAEALIQSVLNESATFYFSLPAPGKAECDMPLPDAQKVALPTRSVENEPSGPDDA